jgi:type IV pilus assembly protein PilM
MPKSDAVWGIDIGNCSLKALRCRPSEEPGRIIADAFDFIEYPKVLTQPGADRAELVADALRQFLSRNSIRGDQVAISVSGQTGLARFVKLPPIEAKRIPDIVKFEAKQQIPFDLNDVIWDFQRIGGGAAEEEGFVLEAEVGLFAMKRDQVFVALEPFTTAGIPVSFVQLAPLALFNFMTFDQITDLPPPDEYDPDNPPPSYVVLSMGTDASDLVVTNGFKVWQRSIPIGGNHFTRALTKELKLTFAKAEHLKRNAQTSEDPKAVFQAMRSVFNDLLTEVQRSIGYFTSVERSAKIEKIVAMGNPVKLPGLRRYLAQGLGYDVVRLEGFRGLEGPEVLNAPAFQENQLCFPVSYGLALQALKKASLRTNLLPKEIVKERVISAKKPWAIAAAAVLLLGSTISLASLSRALGTVNPDRPDLKSGLDAASKAVSVATGFETEANSAMKELEQIQKVGDNVVGNVEGRLRWLELYRAITESLPSPTDFPAPPVAPAPKAPKDPKDPAALPTVDMVAKAKEVARRNIVHIDSVDAQYLESFSDWYTSVKPWMEENAAAASQPAADGKEAAPAASPAAATTAAATTSGGTTGGSSTGGTSSGTSSSSSSGSSSSGGSGEGPQGSGWLVVVRGHHYHNDLRDPTLNPQGAEYVKQTVLKKLAEGQIALPLPQGGTELVSMKEFGISTPVLVNPELPRPELLSNPFGTGNAMMGGGPSGPGGMRTSSPYPGPTGGGPMGSKTPPGGGYGATGPRPAAYPGGGSAGMPGTDPNATDSTIELARFNFEIQFVWQPVKQSERLEKKLKAAEEAAAAKATETPAEKPADEKAATEGKTDPSGAPVPGETPADPAATPATPVDPAAAPATPVDPAAPAAPPADATTTPPVDPKTAPPGDATAPPPADPKAAPPAAPNS